MLYLVKRTSGGSGIGYDKIVFPARVHELERPARGTRPRQKPAGLHKDDVLQHPSSDILEDPVGDSRHFCVFLCREYGIRHQRKHKRLCLRIPHSRLGEQSALLNRNRRVNVHNRNIHGQIQGREVLSKPDDVALVKRLGAFAAVKNLKKGLESGRDSRLINPREDVTTPDAVDKEVMRRNPKVMRLKSVRP